MRKELRNKMGSSIYWKAKFGVTILVLFLLTGCATTQLIDRLPPGTPKGYVEFRLDREGDSIGDMQSRTVVAIYEILSDGILRKGSKPIAILGMGFEIVRIAVVPGRHIYALSFEVLGGGFGVGGFEESVLTRCEAKVLEGMATPISISMFFRRTGEYQLSVSFSGKVEPPISILEKSN